MMPRIMFESKTFSYTFQVEIRDINIVQEKGKTAASFQNEIFEMMTQYLNNL